MMITQRTTQQTFHTHLSYSLYSYAKNVAERRMKKKSFVLSRSLLIVCLTMRIDASIKESDLYILFVVVVIVVGARMMRE